LYRTVPFNFNGLPGRQFVNLNSVRLLRLRPNPLCLGTDFADSEGSYCLLLNADQKGTIGVPV